MTKLVKLGSDCQIDVEKLIESRLLIQANSGGGKSYAVRKLCEVTYGAAQQIIIDPDGEYHTLRERHDYILAGKDGDCPADIKSATLLARRLLELGVSAIIDIYELGVQRALFVKRFLEALVNVPRELWHPVIVVVDEAHKFAPEKDKSESLGAINDLMTLGRKRGFCGVLATQRISKLSKDAAAEANNKLIGRSSLDIDMKRSADEIGMTSRADMQMLRTLAAGEFYAFGPAIKTSAADGVTLIKIGKVATTHLRAGQARSAKPTPTSAKVKKVLAQLADLPQEAAEELRTIGELMTRVKQLEAEARRKPVETKIETQIIEKSVVKPAEIARIEKIVEKLDAIGSKTFAISNELLTSLRKAESHATDNRGHSGRTNGDARRAVPQATPKSVLAPVRGVRSAAVGSTSQNGRGTREAHQDTTLKGGPRAILEALIQHAETGCTLQQLTVLTGYKQTSRYEFLRQLKALDYAYEQGDRIYVSDPGRAAMPDVSPLPTGEELRSMSLARLKGGPKKLLEIFIDNYPDPISKESLINHLEGAYKSTSVYEFTRQLVAHELIEEVGRGEHRASPNLFN